MGVGECALGSQGFKKQKRLRLSGASIASSLRTQFGFFLFTDAVDDYSQWLGSTGHCVSKQMIRNNSSPRLMALSLFVVEVIPVQHGGGGCFSGCDFCLSYMGALSLLSCVAL